MRIELNNQRSKWCQLSLGGILGDNDIAAAQYCSAITAQVPVLELIAIIWQYQCSILE